MRRSYNRDLWGKVTTRGCVRQSYNRRVREAKLQQGFVGRSYNKDHGDVVLDIIGRCCTTGGHRAMK